MSFTLLFPTSAAAPPDPGQPIVRLADSCTKYYSRAIFHRTARRAFKAAPYSTHERRTLRRVIRCQVAAKSVEIVRHHLRRYKAGYRRRQAVVRVTPFPGPNGSRWAIPWPIVACESGGNFSAYNGILGAGGAYQIIPPTWAGYGGRRWAPAAHVASRSAQHIVASRIWAGGAGRGQWAC